MSGGVWLLRISTARPGPKNSIRTNKTRIQTGNLGSNETLPAPQIMQRDGTAARPPLPPARKGARTWTETRGTSDRECESQTAGRGGCWSGNICKLVLVWALTHSGGYTTLRVGQRGRILRGKCQLAASTSTHVPRSRRDWWWFVSMGSAQPSSLKASSDIGH